MRETVALPALQGRRFRGRSAFAVFMSNACSIVGADVGVGAIDPGALEPVTNL
jgi:hypothetical protein